MNVLIKLDELLSAFDWVGEGESLGVDCEAYVCRATGAIHWYGEGVDAEPPEDIDDVARYIAVPRKSEFDLGASLAIRFTEEHLPQSRDTVRDFFRKRGAFGRFKSLLASTGQLDAWHRYEDAAIERALRDWCADNGFVLVP